MKNLRPTSHQTRSLARTLATGMLSMLSLLSIESIESKESKWQQVWLELWQQLAGLNQTF